MKATSADSSGSEDPSIDSCCVGVTSLTSWISNLFFFVFLGLRGRSEGRSARTDAAELFSTATGSFLNPYFLRVGFGEETSAGAVVAGLENFGLADGDGGAGDGSLLLSLEEGVRLRARTRAGGVGLDEALLLSPDEYVPSPKLFAFLNLTVTVSAAAGVEDCVTEEADAFSVSGSTSERSVVRRLRRTGVSTKIEKILVCFL